MSVTVERFEALMSVRRFADAERTARDLIAQFPDWGACYTNLGRAILEQNRYTEALDAAREGVRKSPYDAWAHGIVSLIHERMQKYPEAIDAAKEALRLFPTYSFAFCLLSYSYERLGKYKDALDITTTGLKHHPHDQEMLRFHAFNLYRARRWKEAEEVARECLRLHPTSHEAIDVLGRMAMERAERWFFRRYQLHCEAHEFFVQALRLAPHLEHIRLNARDNAVSCRQFVFWLLWAPYVILIGGLSFAYAALTSPEWKDVGPMALLPVLACLILCFCFIAQPAGFFLGLPTLERWGVPTVPVNDDERRYLQNPWAAWTFLVGVPPIACVLLVVLGPSIVKLLN